MYESTANSRLGEWNPVRSTSKSSRLILSVSNTTSSMPLAQGRLSPVPPAESHDGAVWHR
ncbi:unnamed protein product [Fusarium graminearum]|uniref:Chromosome 4, complete genome n=2 Tax=Gibberella zeae TaxID=5518 RepID=A0A098DR51_GIBZE|nr:unnamed protein product [Fusarium graminearum]CAF3642133.1 unnamed protein product [Fusarium graminearum]CAF3643674.1 unnamed protein product [Fusarium graminearum]CAG1972183.1 unnamed protein product [Fusarium graminearum]CAG1995459.1 unnamed protein product [Fusarium graminearum]